MLWSSGFLCCTGTERTIGRMLDTLKARKWYVFSSNPRIFTIGGNKRFIPKAELHSFRWHKVWILSKPAHSALWPLKISYHGLIFFKSGDQSWEMKIIILEATKVLSMIEQDSCGPTEQWLKSTWQKGHVLQPLRGNPDSSTNKNHTYSYVMSLTGISKPWWCTPIIPASQWFTSSKSPSAIYKPRWKYSEETLPVNIFISSFHNW